MPKDTKISYDEAEAVRKILMNEVARLWAIGQCPHTDTNYDREIDDLLTVCEFLTYNAAEPLYVRA